jgi:PIN domain nuclease of toxin-antitoxin system
MIVLDTHMWRWWVSGDNRFKDVHRAVLNSPDGQSRGISAISLWEIAKAVETGNLVLDRSVEEWLGKAIRFPGVVLIDLSARIAVESTTLPQPFHKDPGDQIIVATARVLDCRLLTADEKILAYAGVKLAWKP